MTGITAQSFSFKNKYTVRNRKALQLARRRKREMPAPPMYLIDPLELNFASTFLQRHSILIHKKVDQSNQLAAMAVAMGATLITEEKDFATATDIIFCGTEQSVMPRVIHQALEQHIRIVSPLWIIQCYRRKTFQDPYLFPCHMNNKRKTLELQVQDQDSNPFDIADQLEDEEEEMEEFEFFAGAGLSDCEMGRGDIVDKSATPVPPVRPKKPTPTKDIEAILNNPSVRELLEKKKKEQMARSSVYTKRLSLRSNKQKNNNQLYGAAIDQRSSKNGSFAVKKGINLWYGQRN